MKGEASCQMCATAIVVRRFWKIEGLSIMTFSRRRENNSAGYSTFSRSRPYIPKPNASPSVLAANWIINEGPYRCSSALPEDRDRVVQRFALAAICFAARGSLWLVGHCCRLPVGKVAYNSDDECTWHGIACGNVTKTVVGIVLDKIVLDCVDLNLDKIDPD